jgi:hypothetical protein
VDNRDNGCGQVVNGGARALFAMLSHAILARMVSRGAASRAHSAQMRRIAASTGSNGSTGTITCFFLPAAVFWQFPPGATCLRPTTARAMPNLPILRFAPWPMTTLPPLQHVQPTLGDIAP